MGEISFAEVEIIPKWEEKTLLHVSFSVSSLVPWETPGAISLYMAACRDTTPLPGLKDNAQDWGLRGKNPSLCEALVFAKQPQVLQNPFPPFLVCCHSVAGDALSAASEQTPQRAPLEVSATFQGIMP